MAKEDEDEALKAIGQAVLFPAVVVFAALTMMPLAVYAAFVAQRYWGWFVTPAFGLAAPSLPTVTGLVLLLRLLAARASRRGDTPDEAKVKRWLAMQLFEYATVVSMFWLMGWLVHLFDGWLAY